MQLTIIKVTQTTYFSHFQHAKHLSLVIFCKWLQELEKNGWVTYVHTCRRKDRHEVWNSYLVYVLLTFLLPPTYITFSTNLLDAPYMNIYCTNIPYFHKYSITIVYVYHLPFMRASYLAIHDVTTVSLLSPSISGSWRILFSLWCLKRKEWNVKKASKYRRS